MAKLEKKSKTSSAAMKSDKKAGLLQNEMLRTGLILLSITFCVALVLSGANLLTEDRIALQEARQEADAMKAVMPQAAVLEEYTGSLPDEIGKAYIAKNESGEAIGVCLSVAPNGFAGPITMAVGIDSNGAITGVQVITMTETPGLGTKAREPDFIEQFTGQSGRLKLVKSSAKDPGDISAISGATITSEAVTKGINLALNAAAAIS